VAILPVRSIDKTNAFVKEEVLISLTITTHWEISGLVNMTLSHKAWRSYTSTSPAEENKICSVLPSGSVLSRSTNSSGKGSSTSSGAGGGSTVSVL